MWDRFGTYEPLPLSLYESMKPFLRQLPFLKKIIVIIAPIVQDISREIKMDSGLPVGYASLLVK